MVGVDHHGAGGAVPHGLLELVGPAPVVGAGLAAEELLAVLADRGIVVEKDEDLARGVVALEVVPAHLRGLDAVAHEDQRHPLEVDHRLLRRRPVGEVGDDLVGDLALGSVNRERRGLGLLAVAHQPDLLEVAVAEGLEADLAVLVGDPLGRLGLAFGARAAASELVAREVFHAVADVLRGDRGQAFGDLVGGDQLVGHRGSRRRRGFGRGGLGARLGAGGQDDEQRSEGEDGLGLHRCSPFVVDLQKFSHSALLIRACRNSRARRSLLMSP